MKLNLRHVTIFLILLALSVGFGFGFDAVCTAVERHNHPRPTTLAASVESNAAEFGIPESILWATVKTGSDFASNAISPTGEIGLMQLTPTQFNFICTTLLEGAPLDAGLLYEPETNLRAGSAWLSYLYGKYGVWEHVFVAYHLGTEATDAWLADPAHVNARGELLEFPTRAAEQYAKDTARAVEFYNQLYYQA